MVVNEVHVVVVGTTSLKNGHHNAVSVGRGSACGDVPCKVRIDVVVRVVDVVPLRTKLRIVGRGALFDVVIQLCRLHKRQAVQRTKHHVLIHRHIVVAEQVNARKRTQGFLQLQVRRNAVVENAFVRDGLWLKSIVQFDNDLAWHCRTCRRILNGLLPPTRGARQTHNQRCEQRKMTHCKVFGEYEWLIQRRNIASEPNIVA